MSAALDQRDFEYAEGLIRIALLRKGPPELVALSERTLEVCAGELALHLNAMTVSLASRGIEFLQACAALAPERLLGWLEHPEDPLFPAALHQVKKGCDWAVPALVAALESSAAQGAMAARAAERLLCLEAIGAQDARFDALLDHAPLTDGVELAGTMLYFGADVQRVSRTIIEALCSSDEDLADAGVRALSGLRHRQDIWREALRRGIPTSIKEYALRQAGMPSEVAQYWQDEDEDDSQQDEDARADP